MSYGMPKSPYRISLKGFDGTDNWVDIKPRRTGEDMEYMLAAAGVPAAAISRDMAAQMRMYRMVLERCIVGWSLKADDADEAPMPHDRDTVWKVLPFELLQYLGDEATKFYDAQVPTPEQLGNSRGASTARSR